MLVAPGLFPDDEDGGLKPVIGREVTEWVFPLFEDKDGREGKGKGRKEKGEEEQRKREREDLMERITEGMMGLDVQLEEQGVEYLVEKLGGLRIS